MSASRPSFETGVPGFDVLLGGGIPHRQSLIFTGQPGTGKTVLASQVAMAQAAKGIRVVLATTTSESQDKLLSDLSSFDFFDRERLGDELFFISVYTPLKKGPKEAREVLMSTLRERGAKLLVIDGLRSVRDLWQDEAKLREFFYELAVGLATIDCVGIFITEYPLAKLIEYPESTTVDGVVSLSFDEVNGKRERRVEVVKLRGMKHLHGQHVMRIDKPGIQMIPRLESVTVPDKEYVPTMKRAGFGMTELDQLLEGGIPSQSSALLVGNAGVGKTLIGLNFAADGARRGEKALVYSFGEPRGSLVARAKRVGLDLEPLISSGALTLEYAPSFEDQADVIAGRILGLLEKTGAKRLLVDDVEILERAIFPAVRGISFFAALLIELRKLGVSSLFTRKISKLVGPELDFSESAVAAIAENLLFARQVELRGRLHRVLSILALRDSSFDPSVREFEILASGVRVLAPLQSAEGLLTGVARSTAPMTERTTKAP